MSKYDITETDLSDVHLKSRKATNAQSKPRNPHGLK